MNLGAAGGGKHTDGSSLPSVLFGGAGGGSDSRGMKRLLKGLSSDDDVAVLDCLTQLCDLITYNADESVLASGFSGGQHINDLVRLLGSPDPTVQLMCVKILTQIFDQLPPIMGLAVQAGISEALTEKLLAIEYMDVAELAISAIEKISAVYPQALVGCGGLGALLIYLDFFPTSIQRLAMRTVANLCSKVPKQHEGQLIDAAPALTNMLGHSDCKMVEKSALALVRAVDSLAASADIGERRQKVEAMAAHGLVSQTINLLATALPENASAALVEMTPSLVELLLRLLARLARYSPSLCAEMAEQKLPSIIHGLLVAEMGDADVAVDRSFERQGSIGTESSSPTTRRRSRSMGGSPGISERGSELICRLLIVLQELLPPLPLDVHPLARGRESATTSEAEGRGPVEKTPCFVRVVHPSGAIYWTDGDQSSGAGHASTHPTNGMLGLGTILRSTGRTAGGCVKRYFCTGGGWVYERNREDGELLVELIDVDSEDAMTSSEAMHKLLMEHDTSEPMVALIPLLVELHRCAVSWPLKALCESIIHQALCHLPSAALEVLEEDSRTVSQLSGLVGRLVSWRVGHGLSTVTGLRLALILLQKAPQEFCESLAREGLIAMASSHAARESFGGRSTDTDAAPIDRSAMSPLTLPVPLTSAFSSACTSPSPSELSVGSPFMSPSCSFLARRLSRSSQPDAHTMSSSGGGNALDELLKDEIEALSLRLVKEHVMATARCAATSDPESSCCLLAGTSSVLDSLTAAAKLLQVNGRAQTVEARAKVAEVLSHVAGDIAGMPSAQRTLALLDRAWSSRGAVESQEQNCTAALEQLCTLLWGRKGMSTFELASSGMVPALMAFLTASEELVDDVSVAPVLATTEGKALLGMQLKLLRRERARAFMRVMLLNRDVGATSSSSTSSSSPLYRSRSLSLSGSGAETPLERLLWQLQACLAASDLFPLVLSTAAQQDGPHGGAKTAATQLNQPLRLRIRCATADADSELQAYLQCKGLCSFSVMIDPLASVRGIREYLERRFAASDPSTLADAERDRLARRQARMESRAAAAGSTPPPKIAAEGEGASEEDEEDDDDDEEELMYEDDDDDDDEDADVEEEDMQEDEEDEEEADEMCGKDVKDTSAAKATSRLSRFRLPFRSQTSLSPSPKTEEGSGGASASEAGASSSEKSLPRTGSGRSLGKSPVFSPRSAKSSETAPTKAFEPSQRYDMRSFVIKINGVQPHVEETPILELAYSSMAARGTSGNSSGSLDLWATTHEVEWIVRPKSSSSPAVASPTAAKGNPVSAMAAPSTPGTSGAVKEEKVCGAQGAEEPKAEVVPSWWVAHPIDEYLTEADPLLQRSCMGKSGMVSQGEEEYDVMRLLRLLYGLNRHVSSLMGPGPEGAVASVLALRQEAWCNKTLSERLALQLKDPLALAVRSLPPWCEQLLRACPFLFPLKVRTEWFYSTSFGLSRALHRISLRAAAEGGGRGSHHHNRSFSGGHGGGGGAARGLAGAVQHLKVRVSRSRLLESADMVLVEYARRRVLVEVEFQNEPGTGSGPTAEFFTLVSQELQKPQQGMWRTAAGGNLGLFPRATAAAPSDDVLKKFKCLGRLIGQALLDERLLDIRLAVPLLSVMTGRRTCTSLPAALDELAGLDPTLSFQMTKLASSCGVLPKSLSPSSLEGDAATLGAPAVDDMCLTFCLPGEDVVPLVGGSLGADTPVTSETLGLYVQRVLEVALRDGVKAQMEALLEGLHDVVPPGALWLFTEEELMTMIAGVGSEMGNDPQDILEAIACDHGYTRASRAVRWLVEILAEMAPEEQRRFLMFVTGSPCLPVGGLRGCNPRLTVVRKVGASGSVGQSEVDVMLPSASTCTNYLKLPEYSSREVMRERLLCSVVHGQHSFHLS